MLRKKLMIDTKKTERRCMYLHNALFKRAPSVLFVSHTCFGSGIANTKRKHL